MTQENENPQSQDSDKPPRAATPIDKGAAPADDSKTIPPSVKPASFVFKIVKADPKNTSSFEDVADK